MGFSSALQGRAAHEALIVRQDAELRLMETMKRSIQMKAKCDKEYAIGLAAVAQQGLKIDRADEMQGSLITKSWRSYMDELDQQAKQFKTNAEVLEVVCEKLAHLSQDKRKARKAYQEEHAKIAARLNHLTDEVVRKKTEYQKHLEGYKALRTRFEEHYIKSGRGGRKLDDVRDKYQKACRKLHLTHNEYVLSISEAIEVEKDFRTVLLPGLLEHQQSVQESFILLWRNILQEASQYGDLTSDKFKEIQKRIDNVINSINPSEEYREFTEKHKTSPTTPLVFQFDDSLIEDIPGKLQSSTLTVDNLTVDWLRSRLLDLEMSVKECQEKQLKMIEHVNGGSPIANGNIMSNGNATNGIQSTKESQNRQSKDLNALRCQEKQKQKLVDMIKCALNEVGCEELPSGCDDHLTIDQNFIENGFNNDQQTSNASTSSASVSIMNELMRRGGVLTLLRGRHFKRKSTPQPTTPTARSRTQRTVLLQPRSQSLGSLSVNTSPAKYETITNPLRMAASVDANCSRGLHDMEFESVIVFERGTPAQFFPKLRRTHFSMLCVTEEPVLSPNKPSGLAIANKACASSDLSACVLAKFTNTNNNNSCDNNNIYAELELGASTVEQCRSVDVESVKSGEMALRQQNVKIEINRVDSCRGEEGVKREACEAPKTQSSQSPTKEANEDDVPPSPPPLPPGAQRKAQPPTAEPMKNSIDAHLDKIDELNRVLDNRLKRALTQPPVQAGAVDLDAIEVAEPVVVVPRAKPEEDIDTSTCSKRTSSSSSDSRAHLSSKDSQLAHLSNGNNKKRSVSFSQKSISAIITNLKEFSKSPLSRMQKTTHNSATLPEDNELREMEDVHRISTTSNEDVVSNSGTPSATESNPSNTNNNTSKLSIKNATNPSKESAAAVNATSTTSTTTSSSKLKFKVPKIQKKSKAIRNTFRSKLMNFQIKRGKLCKICTKRRRIHPSKSVFDFAKEFHIANDNEDDFCTCPPECLAAAAAATTGPHARMMNSATNTEHPFDSISSADAEDEESSDDVLSMKDHCYCVPSLATSVSRRSA